MIVNQEVVNKGKAQEVMENHPYKATNNKEIPRVEEGKNDYSKGNTMETCTKGIGQEVTTTKIGISTPIPIINNEVSSPADKGKTIGNDEMNTSIKILKSSERDNDVSPINNRKCSAGKLNSHQNNEDFNITGLHEAVSNELVSKENIVEVAIIEIAKAVDLSPRQTESLRGSSTKHKGVKGNKEAPTIKPLTQRLAASKKVNKYSNE
ncbi:hypothetical protein KY290_026154 [Solanum tuberosum]|uniref:Uncharacterized protein n=1 Tax=Solanum tuberosum TaxID=4113 RepID=A0ABQ7UVS3_SOLTU|nr:hypothetical protein KY289_025248 [Solanum tuberosum]KAH0677225.1 hypothetical protein KY285_025026 [Solanum tuberosum]KAH0755884.1 hypothetical protein KY290_026154 [Solanum tuberosum]